MEARLQCGAPTLRNPRRSSTRRVGSATRTPGPLARRRRGVESVDPRLGRLVIGDRLDLPSHQHAQESVGHRTDGLMIVFPARHGRGSHAQDLREAAPHQPITLRRKRTSAPVSLDGRRATAASLGAAGPRDAWHPRALARSWPPAAVPIGPVPAHIEPRRGAPGRRGWTFREEFCAAARRMVYAGTRCSPLHGQESRCQEPRTLQP